MKKLLLSLATVALGFSAYADQVTFDFVNNDYGLERKSGSVQDGYIDPGTKITSDGVTITLNGEGDHNWRLWTDGLRSYGSGAPSFSVSANGQDVTYVTWTLKNSNVYVTLEGSETQITEWTGSQSEVSFDVINTSGNNSVVSITVAYGEGEYVPEPEPETPEFDVAGAIAYLNGGNSGTAIVSGIVSEVSSFNGTYGSITYWIKDSLDGNEALQIYGGLGLNGAKFGNQADLVVGSKVQVKGDLTLYTNADGDVIPEMGLNSVILSLQLPDGYETPDVPAAPQGVLTVTEAVNDYILEGYTGVAIVKGVITDITEVSEQYGNATYTIKDSMDAEVELLVYRGYFLDGEKFTSVDQLEVGATVEVEGTLVYYNDVTPEITTGSKIITYTTAGVEGIEVDLNAPAVYYNLQGVRVNNPSNGLYIIRQGNKTVKAVIR